MRKKIVIGNWKMNMTRKETKDFLTFMKECIKTKKLDVVFAVPFTSLDVAQKVLEDSSILYGAQNVHFEPRGAYTGEISVEMLKELEVNFCIVGHSERRKYFNETDIDVNKKVKTLLENNISPIICVGETIEERQNNTHLEKIESQVKKAIADVDIRSIQNVIIAYEPLWAIGTGKTATKDEAEEICSYIRYVVAKVYGLSISDNVRIIYGGSINENNAKEFLESVSIDGALVGGASLKNSFVDIVNG